ncbi:glycosyltransferase family 4 protein [Chloroflexota bacterium]
MNKKRFPGRLALQQRVLPAYRVPFVDALAERCDGGLSVFAGQPMADEQIKTSESLESASFVQTRNIHFMKISSPIYSCWQPGIVAWLEDWQPNVLIVEANPRYTSTRKGIRWMHSIDRPAIGWGLGAPPLSGYLSGWRRSSRIRFIKSLDVIIAYSNKGAEEYMELSYPWERIFVAVNAVVQAPQKPPPNRPLEFDQNPVVLFVGRLQPRKRIDLLIRACADLPESIQPNLYIVGEGPSRAEFESLAGRIYPKAEFPGALFGDELEGYFDKTDLFVLPGTGGLAVQQAMSHGLPVIMAEGDGTQDDLVNDVNGWQVPPGDKNALTNAMNTALSNPELLRRMGMASYRIVLEEVNIDAMADVFIEAIMSVHQVGIR